MAIQWRVLHSRRGQVTCKNGLQNVSRLTVSAPSHWSLNSFCAGFGLECGITNYKLIPRYRGRVGSRNKEMWLQRHWMIQAAPDAETISLRVVVDKSPLKTELRAFAMSGEPKDGDRAEQRNRFNW
jgi:hypothetical protein